MKIANAPWRLCQPETPAILSLGEAFFTEGAISGAFHNIVGKQNQSMPMAMTRSTSKADIQAICQGFASE